MAVGDILRQKDSYEFDSNTIYQTTRPLELEAATATEPGKYLVAWSRTAGTTPGCYVGVMRIDHNGHIRGFANEVQVSTAVGAGSYTAGACAWIRGDIYGVVFQNATASTLLATFEVDSTSFVCSAVIDSIVVRSEPSNDGMAADMLLINDSTGIVVIACTDDDDDGWLRTYSVDAAGAITLENTWEFGATGGAFVRIEHIADAIYAVIYQDGDNDGQLFTTAINSDGTMDSVALDTLEFDTVLYSTLLGAAFQTVYQDKHLIAYNGYTGNDGWIKGVEISDTGAIPAAVEDSWNFDTTSCSACDCIEFDHNEHSTGTVFVLCSTYSTVANMHTTVVYDDGTFAKAWVDSETIDTACFCPRLIRVYDGEATGVVAVFYRGPSENGWVKTYELESAPTYEATQKSAWSTSQYPRSGVCVQELTNPTTRVAELMDGGLALGRTFWLKSLWAFNSHATEDGVLTLWDQAQGRRRETHEVMSLTVPAAELTMIDFPGPGIPFANNACGGLVGGTVAAYEIGCLGYEVGGSQE